MIIPTAYKAVYDKILEENATYSLSNFQVVSNDLVFKASEHKFLLKWIGGTTADDINVHDVPKSDIKFKPFAEIIILLITYIHFHFILKFFFQIII